MLGCCLELLPSSLSTWADWKRQFPETLALDVTTQRTLFDIERQAVVIIIGVDSLAVTVSDLRAAGLVNETVGGEPIVVALPAGTDRPVVWSRRLDATTAEFMLDGDRLVDSATGAAFDARRGLGSDGAMLQVVPSFGSFPADYARIWPEGRVWRPSGAVPADQYSDRPPG